MSDRDAGGSREGGRWQTDPPEPDEPMSAAQRSYLKALAEEAGVPFQGDLTRAEASRRIQALQDEVERLHGDRKKG